MRRVLPTTAVLLALALPLSPAYADDLSKREEQMVARLQKKDWAGALVHARAALALAVRKHGAHHRVVAKHHTNIADLSIQLRKPKEAAKHYRLALAVREKALGKSHGDVGLTLVSLGQTEAGLGQRKSAMARYQRAREIFTAILGSDAPLVGQTLVLIGKLRAEMGHPKDAIGDLEKALAIFRNKLGPNHGTTLDALAHLAWQQRIAGNYADARKSYRSLLEIQRKLTPLSDDVAITTINLALVLKQMGKLVEATRHYRAGLATLEAVHGDKHHLVATALDNLANVLAARGEYREARELLDRAVPMWQSLRGPDHADTAVSMSALVGLLKEMGDPATALPLAEKVVAIFVRVHGATAAPVAVAMDNLASILSDLGSNARAETLYRKALAIHEARMGKDHPSVATGLHNLGSVLRATGKPAEAVPFYERAIRINTRRFGARHPAVAVNQGQLGLAYLAIGNVGAARKQLEAARAINKRALGEAHPHLGLILSGLANVEAADGKRAKARDLTRRALFIAERHLEPLLYATSQRERLELVGRHRSDVHMFLSMFDAAGDAKRAYEKVLRWKAIVLTSMVAQRQALLARSEGKLTAKLARLARVRSELANLAMATPADGERAKTAARLRTLGKNKDRLERDLSRRSETFSAGQRAVAAGFRDVCRALAPKAALVDYITYVKTSGATRRWHLAVFVTLGGKCKSPIRIELGPIGRIDKAIRRYRVMVENNEDTADLRTEGVATRRLVWDPIARVLDGRKQVWVSTDGSLNGVPLGGLPIGADRYLIEDFTFRYVASGKNIVRGSRRTKSVARGNLLVGGVNYGGTSKKSPGASRGRGGCGIQSRPGYKYLRGTMAEVNAIKKILSRSERAVTVLGGTGADEATIKKLMPSSRVVHLATHGFFARPCAKKRVEGEMASNPLVRSGIVLAGANATRSRLVVDGEDGVLTAEEVAELDLRGVELAILSACETGLGDIRAGEGVLGLRWAFEIAGAQSLVMSLWQVPDRQTRELMEAFYEAIGKISDPASALRVAQLKMLRAARASGDSNPWSWSAFIVSGR